MPKKDMEMTMARPLRNIATEETVLVARDHVVNCLYVLLEAQAAIECHLRRSMNRINHGRDSKTEGRNLRLIGFNKDMVGTINGTGKYGS